MSLSWKLPLVFLSVLWVLAACQSEQTRYGRKPPRDYSRPSGSAYTGGTPTRTTSNAMLAQLRLMQDFVPKGRYGRWKHRPMTPRYITIHSTQNHSGDAHAHAKALKRGSLKGNIWHFTVQEDVVIQHMPTNEQGKHADFDGPGNSYSIGIEMCEHRGNDLQATMDRTAKLTAYLMKKHGIPLNRVVPHYHWPRKGRNPANKNCPHFLMTNGRPGAKWQAFVNRINAYYRAIS